MTTNATVEARHKDMAAESFGYSSWTRLSHSEGPRITAIALAQAQDKANLEAARAENADLTNRLAEIDRIAVERKWTTESAFLASWAKRIAALASGHTPSPCPECAAKDEAMGEIAEIADKYGPGSLPCRKIAAIVARFIIPPADPVADHLEAILTAFGLGNHCRTDEGWPAALAELKSRLGGAK